MNHKSQRGVALVLTLIMLAMVTVMAVLFLGVSRRERSSVVLTENQTDAKLAADTGQARAVSEIVARIAAHTNLFAYDFLVSTNFLSPNGFRPNAPGDPLTNVGYVYATSKLPLSRDADIRQNQVNLFYDPRPPVFVVTNAASGASQFRYYLDLNRNGRFDTNGAQQVIAANGQPTQTIDSFVGDPEWIGILARPDLPHSPTNRFIGRYAFVVVPAGKTLDINYIHNNSKQGRRAAGLPMYFRNQGVGPWEINLAAFLRELNTNTWNAASSYSFDPVRNPNVVGGYAFVNALSILNHRYQGQFNTLKTVNQNFGNVVGQMFRNDQIDLYSDGPLMTGIKPNGPEISNGPDDPTLPWSGSDNTNGYTSVQELFDPTKTSANFVSLLTNTIARPGTYDKNTFYRLMSQLGTDSLPANRNKLNLLFDNVDARGVINPSLTTNFVAWTPLRFFTNAADLMLRSQSSQLLATMGLTNNGSFTLSLTNIQIYPVSLYHANVHRLLQLAANIYDSTTNRFPLVATATNTVYAPSVFRPLFRTDGTSIFIGGYEEVTNNAAFALAQPWVDLNVPTNASTGLINTVRSNPRVNAFGVPWVIGVRKGLPNFNEFLLESSVQVTRRMQAFKDSGNNVLFQQAYEIGVSNLMALEAWNSYTQACPFAMDMILTNRVSLVLSNENPFTVLAPTNLNSIAITNVAITNYLANTWSGNQFQIPLKHVEFFVPDREFHFRPTPHLEPINTVVSFDGSVGFPVPNWKLYVTNRVVFALLARDVTNGLHVVDFVNLDNMHGGMDITRALAGATNAFAGNGGFDPAGRFWLTNRIASGAINRATAPANATWGITNQLFVSLTNALSDRDWNDYSKNPIDGAQREKAIDAFRKFLGLRPMFYPGDTNVPSGRVMQVPFTPTRKLDQQLSWQVNDPLVHYTLDDLYDPVYADTNNIQPLLSRETMTNNIGQLNKRYSPWGGPPNSSAPASESTPPPFGLTIKDPMIMKSDDWDFPTNKFPNLGWLGRVHRGTPWQTVYLKSGVEPQARWQTWAGAVAGHPTNDWPLVQLFTTAINDNAARGLLSVNQTNTAAWSAVLSGVTALTNTTASPQKGAVPAYAAVTIQPASVQMAYIVSNINATRLQMPNQVFPNLGSVFASPALTTNSPYLNFSGNQRNYGIRDEVYERIPQQILSLLKEDEPYVVIYAFGQSLRPAENSVVKAPGPYRGLCTNYQVTAEVVTKTGVRIQDIRQPNQSTNAPSYKAIVESFNILPVD